MAKPEDLEEFKEIILQASQGNWIPMTILASCLGVIMILVSYIYTKNEKTNSKRHDSHDKTAEHQYSSSGGRKGLVTYIGFGNGFILNFTIAYITLKTSDDQRYF